MKRIRSHFRFNRQERSGILFLLSIIFILQLADFVISSLNYGGAEEQFRPDTHTQKLIDSMAGAQSTRSEDRIRTFNPNFISDFRGYLLGMNPEEIDRLHRYREKGQFINSAKEFQNITKISDSLLNRLKPYFEFPKWTKNNTQPEQRLTFHEHQITKRSTQVKRDLNNVEAKDLMSIPGIGPVLSQRIIKFKNALGGYIVDDQLFDVYGLDTEVTHRVLEHFTVIEKPEINKININKASVKELASLAYISNHLARSIVQLRDSLGAFISLEELTEIQDFPTNKINRFKLYLTL